MNHHSYRFIKEKQTGDGNVNWVFVPGGPGLGSEYYLPLIEMLDLPGTIWRCDFPDDGSNLQPDVDYNDWVKDFPAAFSWLDNVVLVTHSFSGMVALSCPALETQLKALVLMDTAPDESWQGHHKHSDANSVSHYEPQGDDNKFKAWVVSRADEFVNQESVKKAVALFETLPFREVTYQWARDVFHQQYVAQWVPQQLPTLILAGEKDILTPLLSFEQDERFHRDNIQFVTIKDGSHFPWIENGEDVVNSFQDMSKYLLSMDTP